MDLVFLMLTWFSCQSRRNLTKKESKRSGNSVMMLDILPVFMQGDVTTWVKEHLRLFSVGGKIDISERSLWGSLLIKKV